MVQGGHFESEMNQNESVTLLVRNVHDSIQVMQTQAYGKNRRIKKKFHKSDTEEKNIVFLIRLCKLTTDAELS